MTKTYTNYHERVYGDSKLITLHWTYIGGPFIANLEWRDFKFNPQKNRIKSIVV